MNKHNICICGGGNISHAVAGILAYKGNKINILTRQPEKWSKKINVKTPTTEYQGKINIISSDAKDVIPCCEIIIIAVPIFGIRDIFEKIKPYLTKNMTIIGIPGRLYSQYINNNDVNKIFILRTPYICRIDKYGSSVLITGYCHKEMKYWSNDFEKSEKLLNDLFSLELSQVKNLESINLLNSNSILHPSRLYALYKYKKEYNYKPLFYGEWCLESSNILIECDNELANLISEENKKEKKENSIYVKPLLEHYECENSEELTKKIKSIKSLSKIYTQMEEKNGFFYCDYDNRYITEDVYIGMKYIIDKADLYNVSIPKIKEIYNFFINKDN